VTRFERTVDAIGACARTLAGAEDVGFEAGKAGGVSVSALRAAADRAAVATRFHSASVAARHRPQNDQAARIYDELGQARLDALGVAWLDGVALNLLRHPIGDGLRWRAFAAFSGRDVPASQTAAVRNVDAVMPATLIGDLHRLTALLEDREAFAAAAAIWALAAAQGQTAIEPARRDAFRIPDRPRGGDGQRSGRYALPGAPSAVARAAADASDGGMHRAARAAAQDPVAALIGYRAYTTAFDRVVQAAGLATREEMLALRRRLDVEFRPIRSTVARVAKRLMRALMARQAREWRFDLDEGLLDPSRLAVLVATAGRARPFRQEFESPFPSTAVTLLIDHSGSMRGRPMRIAALTVEVVARVLERCGVRCEVLGFTTGEWDGGEPARLWAAAGYPPSPGRLNALEHIVIKGGDVPWRRARRSLGLLLHEEMLKENIDGEALVWAHGRLQPRPERRKVLIVIADGMPMDEATCAANGFDYLDHHLSAVVDHLERRSRIRLAAIGIGHDVSQVYRHATRIARVDDLGAALSARLLSLLDS
jgi:cobaltochelatase CobT